MIMQEKNIQLTIQGLNRRLKRHFLKETHTFLAITAPSFETVLVNELISHVNPETHSTIVGGVEFTGPLELMYKANLHLRSATRILLRIETGMVKSYPELFNKFKRISWELFVGFHKEFSIEAVSHESRVHHTGNIEQSCEMAITEYMKGLGCHIKRVNRADAHFHIRLFQDRFTVSIDTSGEPLYKRGYRVQIGKAPIRENIAAAICLSLNACSYPVMVDPLCGSGTFVIECALINSRIPPGNFRQFAFEKLPYFNNSHWTRIKEAIDSDFPNSNSLFGFDIDKEVLSNAQANCTRIPFSLNVKFDKSDCLQLRPDFTTHKGIIISNLPYGKRVNSTIELDAFFKQFGTNIKKNWSGWSYAFVSPEKSLASKMGLPMTPILNFSNGGIRVYLFHGKL